MAVLPCRPQPREVACAIFVLVLAAALTGCGAQVGTTAGASANPLQGQVCCVAPQSGPTTVNGIATAHNGWDIAFINWLTPHDAVSSQMAELAPTQSPTTTVRTLAGKIDTAQQTRYLGLAAMASAWGVPVPSTDPAAATGHDHGGAGTNEAADAETLGPLTGLRFDREFLTIMIAHHAAALPIARATIANGASPDAKAMAQTLLTAQTAEITQMLKMVGSP